MNPGFEIEIEQSGDCSRFASFPREPINSLVTHSVDPDHGILCATLGKMYYREDLAEKLRLDPSEDIASLSDAELILRAYRQHGKSILPDLEGDLAVAVLDERDQSLYVWRDPMGAWCVYWGRQRGRMFVGTSLLRLAAVTDACQINSDFLGRYLMYPFAGVEMRTPETALESFHRVAPGELVRFRGVEEPTSLFRWSWETNRKTISQDEAAEEFRRLLEKAVAERLGRGPTVAHLSGGLDSTSLVCLGDNWLRRHQPRQQLATLSVSFDSADLSGEDEYIRMALDQHPHLQATMLPGNRMEHFSWNDVDIPAHDEPFQGLFQIKMETALAEAAASTKAVMLLSGTGAESVADGSKMYIADWLRRGRLASAWSEAKRIGKAMQLSPWNILWRYGIAPMTPPQWRSGWKVWWRRGRGSWPNFGMQAVAPWINPRFARRHRLWEKSLELFRTQWRPPFESSANRFAVAGCVGEWGDRYLAGPRGIQGSRPFLDPRVSAFCLSLPLECRVEPGVAKPLLVRAMQGILPEPIRTRRWKRPFNGVYTRGFHRNLGLLQNMVRRSSIHEFDLFEQSQLLGALQQLASGVGNVAASGRMNSTLGLIRWYDHLPEAVRLWKNIESFDLLTEIRQRVSVGENCACLV